MSSKFVLLLFLLACAKNHQDTYIPCGPGEVFDPVTRKCQETKSHLLDVPIPKLTEVTIYEEPGSYEIDLLFTDRTGSDTLSCDIFNLGVGLSISSSGTCECIARKCYTTLIPDYGFVGVSYFYYSINNHVGTSVTQMVQVNVNPTSTTVSANDINLSVDIGNFLTIDLKNYVNYRSLNYRPDFEVEFINTNRLGSFTYDAITKVITYIPSMIFYSPGSLDMVEEIKYRVKDSAGYSEYANIYIEVVPIQKFPVTTDVTPIDIDEHIQNEIILGYLDENIEDVAFRCEVVNLSSNLIFADPTNPCSCDIDGICKTTVIGDQDPTTGGMPTASFEYRIETGNKNGLGPKIFSDFKFVEITVSPRDDYIDFLIGGGVKTVYMLKDSQNTPIYMIPVFSPDFDASETVYTVIDGPTNGQLSSCSLEGTSSHCLYTPRLGFVGDDQFTFNVGGKNQELRVTGTIKIKVMEMFPGIMSEETLTWNDSDYQHMMFPLNEALFFPVGMTDLKVTVTSSDLNLIDHNAIIAYYGSYEQSFNEIGVVTTPITITDPQGLYDKFLMLKVFPNAGVYGTVNLHFTIEDLTTPNTYSNETTRNFTIPIIINPISVIHEGWDNIKTIGRRTNIRDMFYDEKNDNFNFTGTTPQVNISWDNFSIRTRAGEANIWIKGWHIFRRKQNEHYDFRFPINSTMLTEEVRNYIDSSSDLEPGHNYYYTVKAVDSKFGLLIGSREVFNEVRILIPPDNTALVHRWVVNKEVCNKMYSNLPNMIDTGSNFRCSYLGPGANADGFFDIGMDMLVDLNEAGCPYTSFTENNNCTTQGCVGLELPDVNNFIDGQIFYHRVEGMCYVLEGGSWLRWQDININNILPAVAKVNRMDLPPLTSVSPSVAQSVCASRALPVMDQLDTTGLIFDTPTRLEQVAYSAWSEDQSDASIIGRKSGSGLDNTSGCNTNMANGLSHGFSETIIPSDGFFYAITGTSNSGIRSIATGSHVTRECVSRYGIQDTVGNVKEWVQGLVNCTGTYCSLSAEFDINATPYAFDKVTGPCVLDTSAATTPFPCLSPIPDSFGWTYDSILNNAGKFALPMGLPFVTDFNQTGIQTIGLSGGINRSILHRDGFLVQYKDIMDQGGLGYIATGGDYETGLSSGRYHAEFLTTFDSEEQKNKIGFRCILRLDHDNYNQDFIHPYAKYY